MFKIISILIISLKLLNIIYCHQNQHQEPFQQQQQQQQQHHQQQQQQQYHQQQQQQHPQAHHDPMTDNMIKNDHVLEHLDGIINKPKEKMTQDEQNFYYFKLHDYDNNNMLDGLELVSAFAHNEGRFF